MPDQVDLPLPSAIRLPKLIFIQKLTQAVADSRPCASSSVVVFFKSMCRQHCLLHTLASVMCLLIDSGKNQHAPWLQCRTCTTCRTCTCTTCRTRTCRTCTSSRLCWPLFVHWQQEAAEGINFGRHVSNRLKLYLPNPCVKSYRFVYIWVQSEGGGPGGVRVFRTPPPRI